MNDDTNLAGHVRGALRELATGIPCDSATLDRLVANARAGERRVVALRRRTVWIAPLLAAAAVIAVVVSVGAAMGSSAAHRRVPAGSPSAPSRADSTPAPGSTAPDTTAPDTPTAPTTTAAGSAATPATWNSTDLVIGDHSLGAVTIGMTLTQAAQAAGVTGFTPVGDGAIHPAGGSPTSGVLLYLSTWAGAPSSASGGGFTCVGAALVAGSSPRQTVRTAEGVRLGDPAARIREVYGAATTYVPAPQGGIEPRAGYVVARGRYDLVFALDAQARISAIRGGLAPLTPSECIG